MKEQNVRDLSNEPTAEEEEDIKKIVEILKKALGNKKATFDIKIERSEEDK